jgi:hypothetical protein
VCISTGLTPVSFFFVRIEEVQIWGHYRTGVFLWMRGWCGFHWVAVCLCISTQFACTQWNIQQKSSRGVKMMMLHYCSQRGHDNCSSMGVRADTRSCFVVDPSPVWCAPSIPWLLHGANIFVSAPLKPAYDTIRTTFGTRTNSPFFEMHLSPWLTWIHFPLPI